MLISLHKQATTTPKIRAAIQASGEPAWIVAERYRNVSTTLRHVGFEFKLGLAPFALVG